MRTLDLHSQPEGVAVGAMLSELYSPNLPHLYQVCGFDFCIIDCEHGAYDHAMVAAMVAVARGRGIDVFVRIPGLSGENPQTYLDMGVDGLVVPRIRSTEEVESAVQLTKYPPLGCRGISITRAHSDYAVGDWGEYMEMRNKRFLLFVQIETQSALDQLGSIAGVRGLDGMILGPGDLSVELGIPGEVRHAEVLAALERLGRISGSKRMIAGLISSDWELLGRAAANGYRMLSWSSELGMIARSAKEGVAAIRSLADGSEDVSAP